MVYLQIVNHLSINRDSWSVTSNSGQLSHLPSMNSECPLAMRPRLCSISTNGLSRFWKENKQTSNAPLCYLYIYLLTVWKKEKEW